MRQPMLPLPVPPGHSAPTMLIGSMQWRPERGLRPPPPFVENSRPMMPPFDVGRGFSSTVMSTVRPANLIVVPTRRQEQQNDSLFAFLDLMMIIWTFVRCAVSVVSTEYEALAVTRWQHHHYISDLLKKMRYSWKVSCWEVFCSTVFSTNNWKL